MQGGLTLIPISNPLSITIEIPSDEIYPRWETGTRGTIRELATGQGC